jgi:plastocyanin
MSACPSPVAARCPAVPRRFLRRHSCCAVIAAALLLVATAVFAAAVHRIAQRGRAFSLSQITIARGDSLLFTNDDEFLHQIYVDSRNMNVDSDEQPPGQAIEVSFPRSGSFSVRCHIHPKMLLIVRVE